MYDSPEIRDAHKKYNMQKYNAGTRGIDFEISFDDWYAIWQQSGKWDQRGKGKNKYVMSRHNDIGPYKVGNVSIKSQEENTREANAGDKNPSKRSGSLISAAVVGRKKETYTCINCKKLIGGKSNLLRWHNDKCKDKVYV
jgi:hypothetical protein